ncbi:unnamed protein product [Alopecurus aequalis]
MNFNVLIWNVRGLNNPARRVVVLGVIQPFSVVFVCLQESKLQFVDLSIVRECCGPEFTEFVYAPADGTRGGMLVAWKGTEFLTSNHHITPSFVLVEGLMLKSQTPASILTVYGPQDTGQKLEFLQNLKSFAQSSLQPAVPCIFAGYYNLIVQASDKSNSNFNRRTMAAFRNFINELQLKDLYLAGRRYTWSNEQAMAIMVKLDRVLFNDAWDASFPNCMLQALSSDMSDHCPMLLTCNAHHRCTRHFRFENHWVGRDDFLEVVSEVLSSCPPKSNAFLNLHSRLYSPGS